MKYLVMTEGICEKALLDLLVDRNLFMFSRSGLLYNKIHHLRQLNSSIYEMISQLDPSEEVWIIRIGDKLSDELVIDNDFKDRIKICEKVCTKPEFEVLHIIHEGKYSDFQKKKSKIKPCEFLKTIMKEYEKTYDFNFRYFSRMTNREIYDLFMKYSKIRGGVHGRSVKSLKDLIKEVGI